jgi:predicted DNA-binding transcriptional regulator AlpA
MPTNPRALSELPAAVTPREPAAAPLLLPARQAAAACSVAPSTWWRLHASGKVPSPVRLSGRTLWRAAELAEWVAAGCPPRREWELRRDGPAQRNGRPR